MGLPFYLTSYKKELSCMDTRLTIFTEQKQIARFSALLRAGFKLEARVGYTVKEFLCDQLGLPTDYYEERIQTIFLNSKPVDDAEKAIIRDGATVALSAAMPGLVVWTEIR